MPSPQAGTSDLTREVSTSPLGEGSDLSTKDGQWQGRAGGQELQQAAWLHPGECEGRQPRGHGGPRTLGAVSAPDPLG